MNQNLGQVGEDKADNQKVQIPEGIIEVGKDGKSKHRDFSPSHSLASSLPYQKGCDHA